MSGTMWLATLPWTMNHTCSQWWSRALGSSRRSRACAGERL